MNSSGVPGGAAPFSCLRCGKCCRWGGHVLLEEDDITDLASGLGMPESEFIARYTELARNRHQLSLINRADGACVFLDGNHCRVYERRPEQCRTFPGTWSVPGCPALDASDSEA